MIKNYIFDFGNVLCEFVPTKITGNFVSDEKIKKTISEVVFDRTYWDKLDMGTISDDNVKNEVKKRLSKEMGVVACQVYDNWINTISPIKEMISLVNDLHKNGKRLYLLSNISVGFANAYSEVKWIDELFSVFDGLVFSGPLGIVKPNTDIYKYLINEYSLNADECLFIDDTEKNIKGAQLAGISGYLFDGDVDALRKNIGI